MPKHESINNAGNPLTPELKEVVEKLFGRNVVDKLERLGGKVTITVTAPFRDKKDRLNRNIKIDNEFVMRLHNLRDNSDNMKNEMNPLTAKKLRELSKLIGHPVRTKSTRQEIIEELISHLRSEDVWKRIAG